jgi:putative component of membrane protein insertase Oxa1/YidC/SpoIIIJ protein YidD
MNSVAPTLLAHVHAVAKEKHGPLKGIWLTARRLARCHPVKWLGGGGSGFDPVPDKCTHHP